MDSRYRYNVGSVLLVEVIQIRLVLEVVCVYLAAVYYIVRLYIVCELHNIQGDVLLSQDIFCQLQDVCMGRRGSRYGNSSSCQCVVIYTCVITICGIVHGTDHCSVILLCDVICYRLALQGCLQSFDLICVLIALLNCQDIAVRGRGAFHGQRVLCGVQTRVNGIVGIDDSVIYVLQHVRYLRRLYLFEGDIIGILRDICYGSGDTCAVLQLDVAVLLQQKKGSRLIGGIVRYCDGNSLAAAAACSQRRSCYYAECQCRKFLCQLSHNILLLVFHVTRISYWLSRII